MHMGRQLFLPSQSLKDFKAVQRMYQGLRAALLKKEQSGYVKRRENLKYLWKIHAFSNCHSILPLHYGLSPKGDFSSLATCAIMNWLQNCCTEL